MLNKFKDFAMRGNVVDLAVGVIIGAAFGKIVDSLVNDIIMPLVGLITGGIDFSARFLVLASGVGPFTTLAEAKQAGVPVLAYGVFITTILQFFIIAFAIFIVVRQVNKAR